MVGGLANGYCLMLGCVVLLVCEWCLVAVVVVVGGGGRSDTLEGLCSVNLSGCF